MAGNVLFCTFSPGDEGLGNSKMGDLRLLTPAMGTTLQNPSLTSLHLGILGSLLDVFGD